MSFDREIFFIRETNLADALGLNYEYKFEEFLEIIDYLVEYGENNIRLKEWVHFIVERRVNNQPIRVFSMEGALAATKYFDLEQIITKGSVKNVLNFIEEYRINKIDAEVCKAIGNNSSSLVLRYGRHWLSQKDVVNIFKTNYKRLKTALHNIQNSELPMQRDVDFCDYESTRFFSLSGLEKISQELSIKLRNEERREYCERVNEVAPPTIEGLAGCISVLQKYC
ncbi:hypothetical protein POG22_01290 [Geitlerinema sp. CS-897]|nr:hypothetical protein [Geitlerinema sp. CS-897]